MLITQLKAKEAITSLTAGKKVFIINCHGCKEVRFPEKEAARLQKELAALLINNTPKKIFIVFFRQKK